MDKVTKGPARRAGGRPKGAENTKTIVLRIAQERHEVTEGGQKRTLSTVELILHLMRRVALAGNLRAQKQFDKFVACHEVAGRAAGYLVVPADLNSIEEWTAMYGRSEAKDLS